MIRVSGNQFVPGSLPPRFVKDVGDFVLPPSAVSAMASYVSEDAWKQGINFAITGGPSTGKTSVGLALMQMIFRQEPTTNVVYWVESDFHSDLRNLWRYEGLVEKSPNDAPLWAEYNEWERSFWDLKEASVLFLDDLGRGTTPNQRYEVETMLRRRRDMGIGTVAASSDKDWGFLPESVKALFTHDGQVIELKDEVHAGR